MKKFDWTKFLIVIFIIFICVAIVFDIIKMENNNTDVLILKEDLVRKPDGKLLQYTKLKIEGHDYFVLKEKGLLSKNSNPIHCEDCEKCKM